MGQYHFQLIDQSTDPIPDAATRLAARPQELITSRSDQRGMHYDPSRQLVTAINTAIAVGEPLLLTGEPGTGKTEAAYFVAHKLGLELIRFQAKSTSTAQDLLYSFDTVRYFHDAQIREHGVPLPPKKRYVDLGPLGQAISAPKPKVLLIDEIDKAPREFPNDLLYELETLSFTIKETGEEIPAPAPSLRPIVLITSNRERTLPDAFLRRVVYHHISLNEELIDRVIESIRQTPPFSKVDQPTLDRAQSQFTALRERCEHKKPAISELLTWLHLLHLEISEGRKNDLDCSLGKLPFLNVLVKHRDDLEALGAFAPA